MADDVECVVIGAGVVGLACAAAIARTGREVVVLEQHGQIGTEISSRNSEVIHAGIYYPPGSLKARLCVRGKMLLYAHCEQFAVPHQRCGKLIVATHESHLETLRDYQRTALANGVGELPWRSPAEMAELEPEVRCIGAIWSPTTGIIDSHAYMASLVGEIEAHGGAIAFHSRVTDGCRDGDCIRITTPEMALDARWVVNSTGLHAPEVARCLPHGAVSLPRAHYAKGHYYTLSGRSPFRHLVYPVAEAGGLGVHVTLDLAGQARFGPDVQWIEGIDYDFDGANRAAFVAAIERYYPGLDAARLHAGYTGIRPKLGDARQANADFLLLGPRDHGVPGVMHLLGIESPGLTASLAIAEAVLNSLTES